MKLERQNKIIEIIRDNVVETQEDLTARLIAEGYRVTQATVSRDMKDLHIIKDEYGRYKYAADTADTGRARAQYQNMIEQTVVRAQYANNLVVLKTYAGMAQAVGAAIDSVGFEGTIGCIAGDDTILVVARDVDSARTISEKITEIITHR